MMKLRLSLSVAFLAFIAVFFQNCYSTSGSGGEGSTAGNPIDVHQETLKIGLSAFDNSEVEFRLCVSKVQLHVIDLDESIDLIVDEAQTVGTVTNLFNGDIGEARIRLFADGTVKVTSWFNDKKGTFIQMNSESDDQFLFEMDIPDGLYEIPRFVSYNSECDEIPDSSLEISNSFGDFNASQLFHLSGASTVAVKDGLASRQTVETADFVDGLQNIQSNSELDTFLESGDF